MPMTDLTHQETLDRSKFFQTVQVWPLNDDLNYQGWINNFDSDEEKIIAAMIIDFFIYYPKKMVDQLFKAAIGNAGYKLSRVLPDWKHSDFFSRCIYSYIPGESSNISDSGFTFARKLKEVLEIPEDRLFEYTKIPKILDEQKQITPVILVDDFIGSGAQCYKAWMKNKNSYNSKTFYEIAQDDGHVFVYAPLIVNLKGYNRIQKDCPNLHLTPAHILGPEYNLFNKECICWKGDEDLFIKGTELILRKSSELGIPSTGGDDPQDEKGFDEQGLALKFEHGAPDAIPAFFYWCHDKWTPLFNKTYER
jgi:hypothetical protein